MEQLCNQNNQLLCYFTRDKQNEDLNLKKMAQVLRDVNNIKYSTDSSGDED